MDRIHPFVRIPGGAPYSDYNTDRGVAEQITAEACRLLVADHDCGLDEEQRFHGTGRIEYESGLVYEGDLAHGRATGRGKLFWPSGEAYEGTVRNGRAWGEGRMEWPNGTTYEGSMLDGKRHGFGVLVAASGVRYEGEWAGGKREGRGRLVYGVAVGPDGQRVVNEYVGQFRADRRHGVGTLRYASGSVYEGEWRDDRKAGQGVMVWPASGQVYKGGWADDQPDGQGVSVWERTRPQAADEHSADASRRPMCTRYEGGFRGGARHGVGTLYYADGAKYTGTWREGLKEGLGVMVSADGAVYEGVFEADRPRDGPQRRSDAPPSPRTTERQTAYSLHVDDVITGALPSVKARGAGSLAGPAGAALAGLSAARAVGGAVLAGGGVVGGRGLALATRRDATATQNVLSRWLPLLRRWYDAACVEGSTAMGGPLEISDGEGKPVRVVMEAGSSVDADGTGAAASEQGRADGRSEVPGLALRTLATLGEIDNEEEEEEDEDEEDDDDDEEGKDGDDDDSAASGQRGQDGLVASKGSVASGAAAQRSRASLEAAGHAVEGKEADERQGKEGEFEQEDGEAAGGRSGTSGRAVGEAGSDAGSRPSLRIDGALSRQSEGSAPAGEQGDAPRGPEDGAGGQPGRQPGSARSEGMSLTGRQAAMAVAPMHAHRLAAMGASDALRSAGADPVAVASAGVFAMPQRGLWRVARAMGLLRPPVTTAVVDRVLLLVRARHVRRALAGLETTREREMPSSASSSPQAGPRSAMAGEGGLGLDPARKSVSVGLLPSPAAHSSSRSGMSATAGATAADGSFAEPQSPCSPAPAMLEPLSDAEFAQLRARIAAPLAGPRHDPARPVLFREFLEVVVRLCRILYSGGRRPPTDPAALEAAAQHRQEEAAALTAQQSLATTFVQGGGGFAPSSGPASPMVSGSVSVAGPPRVPPRPSRAVPASSLAFAVDCALWYMAVPAAAQLGVAALPGGRMPGLLAAGSPTRHSPSQGAGSGAPTPFGPPSVAAWGEPTPAASPAGSGGMSSLQPGKGRVPSLRSFDQHLAWDMASGGLRSLLFRPDALAGLDALAPALRVLFLRYSVPDDGPAMVPTSVDPGALADMVAGEEGSSGALSGTLAAARKSVHGRVVNGHGLLRMVRDAGLFADDFGAEQVAVLMRRSLFDLSGASGRADLGATCGGLATGQVTTGVVAPRREVAEAEAAAEEEDDNVAIADCGLVLVPDEEEDGVEGAAAAEASEAGPLGRAGSGDEEAGLGAGAAGKGAAKQAAAASKRPGAGAGAGVGAGAGEAAPRAKASGADAKAGPRGPAPRTDSEGSSRGSATARSAASSSKASAATSAATRPDQRQRKPAKARTPIGPGLPDLGAEATAADWPLILARLMLALLRLAPRRAARAVAHERRWAEAKRELEEAAQAKAQAAAQAAAEAAAANKKAKKKPAKKGAPAEPEPVFEAEPVTAAQIEAVVGPPPSPPLLMPGASAPASAREVRDCGAAPGRTPVALGRGAPLADKLQVFLSTVLLRRLAVPGFTEAFARADPLSEAGSGGRLSARRSSRSPRTGLSAAEAAAASAAAAMEVAKLR
ncbi:hypothetical protein FNF29_07901 [Cafeteria roenbergensis]|uniref:Uncharacterized protein n=1 Tax=Cafeteria roenbergensis TaxID=33653 RepID=A0A5A8C2D8_CAFRO|nr:hypothetical protein FNF29_07901 [Cafeteria roenbergensis]|eukprot:KAA0146659.1 hypothetical protein FNF29_07901 [Cafeteria roenbergensis]